MLINKNKLQKEVYNKSYYKLFGYKVFKKKKKLFGYKKVISY